jgi:hypothetical protein
MFLMSSTSININHIFKIVPHFGLLCQKYMESLSELRQSPNTNYSAQLFPIIYNLLLIDRANLVNDSHMIDKVFQLTEFLTRGMETPHPELNNTDTLALIGNHYPKKMKHCLKCRVCRRNNKLRGKKNENSRKSKYVCEGCSDYFGQKVHLCVECFKKFHAKIMFFMNGKHKMCGDKAHSSLKLNKPKKVSQAIKR